MFGRLFRFQHIIPLTRPVIAQSKCYSTVADSSQLTNKQILYELQMKVNVKWANYTALILFGGGVWTLSVMARKDDIAGAKNADIRAVNDITLATPSSSARPSSSDQSLLPLSQASQPSLQQQSQPSPHSTAVAKMLIPKVEKSKWSTILVGVVVGHLGLVALGVYFINFRLIRALRLLPNRVIEVETLGGRLNTYPLDHVLPTRTLYARSTLDTWTLPLFCVNKNNTGIDKYFFDQRDITSRVMEDILTHNRAKDTRGLKALS